MADPAVNSKYKVLVQNLPDPTGTLSMRQRLEVFFFGGLVTDTIPANVCRSLRLEAGKFDSPTFLNSVSQVFAILT